MPDLRKHTVFITAGATLANVTALGVAITLSRILPKEIYGTYRQTFFIYRILLGIIGLNLAASMLYFLPRGDSASHPTILGRSLLMAAAVGGGIGLVILVVAYPCAAAMKNPPIAPILYLLIPYAVFNQLVLVVPNSLLGVGKASLVLVYDAISAVGRAASIILPFAMGLKLWGVFVSIVAWEFALAAIGIFMLQTKIGISFRRITLAGIHEHFAYTWPLLAAAIIGTLSVQFDKAVIALAFNPARFAEYANGAIHIPLVMILITSLSRSIRPEMAKHAQANRINAMLGLWRSAAAKGASIVFPLVAFFLLCPDYVIVLLYGRRYLLSTIPFAIYCIGLVIRIAFYGSIFQAMGRNRMQIIGAVSALVCNVVLTLLLVWIGLTYFGQDSILAFAGPAIGTVIGTIVSAGVLIYLISRITSCPTRAVLPVKHLAKVALVTILAAGPTLSIRWLPIPTIGKCLTMVCVFGGIYLVLALRSGVVPTRDAMFIAGLFQRAGLAVARIVRREKRR